MQNDKIFAKRFEAIVKPLITFSRRIWIELVNDVARALFCSKIPIVSEGLALELFKIYEMKIWLRQMHRKSAWSCNPGCNS
jgi:hypothetical protein